MPILVPWFISNITLIVSLTYTLLTCALHPLAHSPDITWPNKIPDLVISRDFKISQKMHLKENIILVSTILKSMRNFFTVCISMTFLKAPCACILSLTDCPALPSVCCWPQSPLLTAPSSLSGVLFSSSDSQQLSLPSCPTVDGFVSHFFGIKIRELSMNRFRKYGVIQLFLKFFFPYPCSNKPAVPLCFFSMSLKCLFNWNLKIQVILRCFSIFTCFRPWFYLAAFLAHFQHFRCISKTSVFKLWSYFQ